MIFYGLYAYIYCVSECMFICMYDVRHDNQVHCTRTGNKPSLSL